MGWVSALECELGKLELSCREHIAEKEKRREQRARAGSTDKRAEHRKQREHAYDSRFEPPNFESQILDSRSTSLDSGFRAVDWRIV